MWDRQPGRARGAGGRQVDRVDLAPPMLAAVRRAGEAAGVGASWIEGDAEDLPVPDAAVDVVVSSFGCMFAPRHAVAARELARALRPGARLGVLTWPMDSDVAEFLSIRRRAPAPPPAVAQSPLR